MRKVAIIIPAYNEEAGIARVLRAATQSKLASEVIVVSDGSTDRTVEMASKFKGVRVIALKTNVGKGGAMCAGAEATDAEVITFVDADLNGLTAQHIDQIIVPLEFGQCEMCLGVFRGGKFWSSSAQLIFPYISGQRAISRELFLKIPNLKDLRFGVEIAIHNYFKRTKYRVRRVVLRGVSNSYKEEKFGFRKGLEARRKMYGEIYRANRRDHRRATFRKMKRPKMFDLSESEINTAIKKLRRKKSEDKRKRKLL